jgi:hypothetical protein
VHRTATAISSTADPSYSATSYPFSAVAASATVASVASFPKVRSSPPPDYSSDADRYSCSAVAASAHSSSDEYPSSVQELVMNGFPLSKVLHAYDLIGDNFDDLLSFLLASTS